MKAMRPDDTDWKIIDRLRQEYVGNTVLAREIGVSEGAIRQRLKRLKEAGILKVTAQIDPEVLDNQQLAVIAINVGEAALLQTKATEVAALDKVLSVAIVTGRYDLMAEILVDSNHGLVDFLTCELPQVSGITTTESFLLLKSFGKYV